ncbi:MAG: dTDP-4-dehydrorhamnose reductase [Candidatus Baldrarchaeia archaeon]
MVDSLKVLVTGSSGLLGEDVARIFREAGHDVIEVKGRLDCDLTDADRTFELVHKFKPQLVIHCAGTHNVDEAEKNPIETYINVVLSTRNVANACKTIDATLVYPGSAYIFDGLKDEPYIEVDEPNPINIYGKAKLASEKVITEVLPEHFIIRLPIVFGSGGKKERNFIYGLFSKVKEQQVVEAAYDQICCCAYTADVADAFLKITKTNYYGIYHLANSGFCSRYELYREIVSQLGLPVHRVVPRPMAELKRPAKRPKYTVLSTLFAEKVFQLKMRHWKEALTECIKEFRNRYG